ncbi:MAG: FadR family transcriptional regulator [Synergistaceae bacterium]|jgi:DNA-binding FadR family transcriptional regulator|nr:FadR family transcriptional regulator [Synergistaceae bacterium]
MAGAKQLAELAVNQLVDYILANNLSTGAKLPNEFELARLLKVGRSTVREAVKSLTTRHVLEVRQGAGTFVAERRFGVSEDPLGFTFVKNKQKLVEDILEVRMIIEPRIAAMAAVSAVEADIAELYRLCEEVEQLIAKDEDHMHADVALHAKIAESSGNLVVPNLLPIIQSAISLFVDITNRQLRQETIETHRMIINAIAAHDPVGASDGMTMHIIYNRNSLRSYYNTSGSFKYVSSQDFSTSNS